MVLTNCIVVPAYSARSSSGSTSPVIRCPSNFQVTIARGYDDDVRQMNCRVVPSTTVVMLIFWFGVLPRIWMEAGPTRNKSVSDELQCNPLPSYKPPVRWYLSAVVFRGSTDRHWSHGRRVWHCYPMVQSPWRYCFRSHCFGWVRRRNYRSDWTRRCRSRIYTRIVDLVDAHLEIDTRELTVIHWLDENSIDNPESSADWVEKSLRHWTKCEAVDLDRLRFHDEHRT